MKKLLLLAFLAGPANAQTSQPLIWSGSNAQVLPTGGVLLPENRPVIFTESPVNGGNTVTVNAATNITNNRAWTIPNIATNQNFLGDSGSQVVTNKTIDCALNTCSNIPGTGITGLVPLANGGTNKNNSAVAGAVSFSDATTIGLTAAGTSGQYLKSAGTGTPVWSAVDLSTASVTGVLPLANGGTNKNMTASAGSAVYSDADSLELTAVGIVGQTLTSAGSGTPAWAWHSILNTSAAYVITNTDGYTGVNLISGSSNRTITLPAASSNGGRVIQFAQQSTSVMTIAAAGSDTIGPNAETSITLSFAGDSVALVSDGTSAWSFIGSPYYQSASVNSTFSFNGSGSTSSAVALRVSRSGYWVSVAIPNVNANTGTSSTAFTANTALPTWARPGGNSVVIATNAVRNNGTSSGSAASNWSINSSGIISLALTTSAGSWTNSASGGTSSPQSITFYVGHL